MVLDNLCLIHAFRVAIIDNIVNIYVLELLEGTLGGNLSIFIGLKLLIGVLELGFRLC